MSLYLEPSIDWGVKSVVLSDFSLESSPSTARVLRRGAVSIAWYSLKRVKSGPVPPASAAVSLAMNSALV